MTIGVCVCKYGSVNIDYEIIDSKKKREIECLSLTKNANLCN